MIYPCVCGHREAQHQHYRSGEDCSALGCGCRAYRPNTLWRRLAARIRRRLSSQNEWMS
jgi:hypothetical protein